jgi:polyhydroxyalkanoate synthesis regulator phasin
VDRLVDLADLPRAEAERFAVELRDALVTGRRQLEQRLEEDVRAYLSRLRFPSREDLSAMTARVEGLEARASALERKR